LIRGILPLTLQAAYSRPNGYPTFLSALCLERRMNFAKFTLLTNPDGFATHPWDVKKTLNESLFSQCAMKCSFILSSGRGVTLNICSYWMV
jgi:hypothetical protein